MKPVLDTKVPGRPTNPEAALPSEAKRPTEDEPPGEPKGPNAGTPPEPTDFEKLRALIEEWRANPGEDEEAILADLERALEEEPLQFGELDLSD